MCWTSKQIACHPLDTHVSAVRVCSKWRPSVAAHSTAHLQWPWDLYAGIWPHSTCQSAPLAPIQASESWQQGLVAWQNQWRGLGFDITNSHKPTSLVKWPSFSFLRLECTSYWLHMLHILMNNKTMSCSLSNCQLRLCCLVWASPGHHTSSFAFRTFVCSLRASPSHHTSDLVVASCI